MTDARVVGVGAVGPLHLTGVAAAAVDQILQGHRFIRGRGVVGKCQRRGKRVVLSVVADAVNVIAVSLSGSI